MKEQQKTKGHGGYRPGAGRKQTGIKTTTIAFRVPEEIALLLKDKIAGLIKKETKKLEKSLQKSK